MISPTSQWCPLERADYTPPASAATSADNRGGLHTDVAHAALTAPCLCRTGERVTPVCLCPGPLLSGPRCTGDRDDGDETPHLMITVYPDHAYLARKDEVREVWNGALDICKVVGVKASEVV